GQSRFAPPAGARRPLPGPVLPARSDEPESRLEVLLGNAFRRAAAPRAGLVIPLQTFGVVVALLANPEVDRRKFTVALTTKPSGGPDVPAGHNRCAGSVLEDRLREVPRQFQL